MSYISEAHARLAGLIEKNAPPKFGTFNSPDTFDFDAVDHLSALAGAINDYLHSFALELQSHGVAVASKDYIAPLADPVSDLIAACNEHAYGVREDALEAAQ